MLSCREMTEIVTEYLEGRMSLMERMRFQFHLGMCVHCRGYLAQMKQTIRTLGTLPDEPMPPEVCEALIERFRGWKEADPDEDGSEE